MKEPGVLNVAARRAGWLTVILALGLSLGCGFQPRGQSDTFGRLEGSYAVTGLPTNSRFYRALRKAVTAAGGTWTTDRAAATTLIEVKDRTSDSRVLSIDSRNRAVEYELEEAVEFAFRIGGEESPRGAQTVRVLRTLFRPPDAVLASDRESDLLRNEMRDDLADRVVLRIAAQR
jgi:outer membrane lipopolysaccharide assembly protein LptE/RlpB